jgi:hypothetical protein
VPVDCEFALTTPPGQGGVAVFALNGDIDAALDACGVAPTRVGQVALRVVPGVESGVVARWSVRSAHVMTHSGIVVIRRAAEAFCRAGLRPSEGADAWAVYPEARDRLEALALRAIARAESPLAIDLLLDQRERWRAWDGQRPSRGEIDAASASLTRLLRAPTVAVVGAPNVGKSTLTNAMASRSVSLVSEEPGATRDYVGVSVDLAGLTVRWIDTPGLRRDGGEEEEETARELAERVVRAADLVLACGDAEHGFLVPKGLDGARTLRVATRADLGEAAASEAAGRPIRTAAAGPDPSTSGVLALAEAVRERLLPAVALAWRGPWAFDEEVWGCR